MPWQPPSHKADFAHRVFYWAQAHQWHILITLLLGVGFFAVLAGITLFREDNETKAKEALYKAQGGKEALEELVLQFPGSKASFLALVEIAKNEIEEKNYDAAIAHYEKLYELAPREIFFRVFALHGIAYCHLGKGEYGKGAEFYGRAAKEPGHVNPNASRYEEARSLKLLKAPEAKALFQDLLLEEGLSAEIRQKIEEELLWDHLKESL